MRARKEYYNSTLKDKREVMKVAIESVLGIECTVQPLNTQQFIAHVGKYDINIPYQYWKDWTLGDIISYIREYM